MIKMGGLMFSMRSGKGRRDKDNERKGDMEERRGRDGEKREREEEKSLFFF